MSHWCLAVGSHFKNHFINVQALGCFCLLVLLVLVSLLYNERLLSVLFFSPECSKTSLGGVIYGFRRECSKSNWKDDIFGVCSCRVWSLCLELPRPSLLTWERFVNVGYVIL
jgi:hypothetical protein